MTKRKILLIQSPEMQGNGTKRHLEAIGLEVIWAGSGLTALMQARKAVIDLILLDVALPDIEGLDLCHRLRVRQDMRTIPIVLLAPRGSMQEDAKREADGPDTYLWKPYLEKDMDNLISSILDAKAAAMEPASRPVLTLVQKKDSVRERRSSTESATMEEPRPSLIAVPQPSKPDLKLVIKTEPILQPESAKSFVLQEDQQKKQEPEASRSPIPLSNTGQPSVTRQDTIAPSPIPPFSGTGETVVDPDTGLFGRPQFEAMFSKEFKRAIRFKQSMSCMMINLNGQKLNRQADEALVKAIIGLVRRTIREVDTAAWWSGEAFMVLLPNTVRHDAVQAAARILEAVANHPFTWPDATMVTMSIGVAGMPDITIDTEHKLIEVVNAACSRAQEMMLPPPPGVLRGKR